MRVKGRRGLITLAAVTASVAVSGIGAGGAQAALHTPCTGNNIAGQGSSLQRGAQNIWTASFKTNMNGGCTTGPTAGYTATSSGACLNKWHADNVTAFDNTVAFCGTDDAPTTTQITNINTPVATGGSGAKVLSIPVAQAAIAILANPPAGCSITAVSPSNLEQAFRGSITTWAGLGGTGCGTATITRVVRRDSSGTTYQLKHYLGVQNGAAVHGTLTWANLQDPANNQTWPGTTTTSQSGCLMAFPCGGGANSGSGGGDEAKTVGVTSGGLGYAALSDARSVYASTTYTNLKWLKITGALGTTIDPSTNNLSETAAKSNCPSTNGSYGTLPASTTVTWANVYESSAGSAYPICTLTWDTALTDYSQAFGVNGTKVATTVHDYLGYVLNTAGGQADALSSNNDYAPLPEDVSTSAVAGLAEITD
jgi:hypothetical protein